MNMQSKSSRIGLDRSDEPILELEVAFANGAWGWRWASIAVRQGPQGAAAHPLPAQIEIEAKELAKTVTFDPVALATHWAKFPCDALVSYRTAARLAAEVRRSRHVTEPFLRRVDEAVALAERQGRAAALIARMAYLAAGLPTQSDLTDLQP